MSIKNKILISLALILVAVAGRFLPHLWNATPISAIAILATAYLGFSWSFGIIFIAMFASDLFIGFYDLPVMISVYTSLVLIALLGKIAKNKGILRVISTGVLGTLAFFLVTNFAVWAFSGMYPATFSGLMNAYFMGLPFVRNQILGDIFYVATFFGIFKLFSSTVVFWRGRRQYADIRVK